jgi:hypothetical protein
LNKTQRFRGNLIFKKLDKIKLALRAARGFGLRFPAFDLFDLFLQESQDFRGVFDIWK